MPRKDKPITVRLFVPDGSGGYRNHDDLTPDEQRDFGRRLVGRMGEALNDYFSAYPEAYRAACRAQENY